MSGRMRTCTKCGHEGPEAVDFPKKGTYADGRPQYRAQCKACMASRKAGYWSSEAYREYRRRTRGAARAFSREVREWDKEFQDQLAAFQSSPRASVVRKACLAYVGMAWCSAGEHVVRLSELSHPTLAKCKACRREQDRQRYGVNVERLQQLEDRRKRGVRWCAWHKREEPLNNFGATKGLCKQGLVEYVKEWRRANPDRSREYQRRTAARRANDIHIPYTDREVFKITGGYCYLCGVGLDFNDRSHETGWHVEHVFPRSRSRLDCMGNLLPACGPCNLSKGDRPVLEVLTEHGLTLSYVLDLLRRSADALDLDRVVVHTM